MAPVLVPLAFDAVTVSETDPLPLRAAVVVSTPVLLMAKSPLLPAVMTKLVGDPDAVTVPTVVPLDTGLVNAKFVGVTTGADAVE